MADVPWDQDVTTDDTTPVSEWNAFKDRLISIAGDKSIGDGFLLVKQGTTADRPSAGYDGRLYYSTDEGIWYRDNGSSWDELVRAEGQIRLDSLAEQDYSSLDNVPSSFPPEAHSIGGAEHNSDTLASLNGLIDDATIDDMESTRPPESHNIAGSAHGTATIRDFNAMIDDGNFDDEFDTRPPEVHGNTAHDQDYSATPVSDVESAGLAMRANVNPDSDNARQLGKGTVGGDDSDIRWSEIHAVDIYGTVHYADLSFTEKRCEVCGEKFKEGDKVSLVVNEMKEDGTYLVPKHQGC